MGSFRPRDTARTQEDTIPDGCTGILSPACLSVWKFLVQPWAIVAEGDQIAFILSMKMAIVVPAPAAGVIRNIVAVPRMTLPVGDVIVMTRDRALSTVSC